MLGKSGDAERHGDPRQSGAQLSLFEGATEVLGARGRAGPVRLGQEDHEHVAAETGQHVAAGQVCRDVEGAAAGNEKPAQGAQQGISAGEAEARVDVPEAIDARQHQRAGSTVAPSALDLLAHALLERRSEEHTSELQSRSDLVCRLLLEKNKWKTAFAIAPATTTMTISPSPRARSGFRV